MQQEIQQVIITNPKDIQAFIDNAFYKYLEQFASITQSIIPQSSETNKDFRIKEAQADLKISRSTLNTLLRTGQLEYYNIGRSVRIPKAAIEKFKENQKGS